MAHGAEVSRNEETKGSECDVLMLGERDAYVASHGSRALGVAIFNPDLRSDAIGLLDVSIKEEAHREG
jgi:hypothetical protein